MCTACAGMAFYRDASTKTKHCVITLLLCHRHLQVIQTCIISLRRIVLFFIIFMKHKWKCYAEYLYNFIVIHSVTYSYLIVNVSTAFNRIYEGLSHRIVLGT